MKKRIPLLLLLLCLLPGCREEAGEESQVVCVSTEDCFLCSHTAEAPWGRNNLGLVSLNTFDIVPIEINWYNDAGEQIEEKMGMTQIRSVPSEGEGFRAFLVEDPDRGYATANVTLGEDRAIDREKMAAFLCEDCLEAIAPEEEGGGLGVLSFADGKLRALDRQVSGFHLGGFFIHCDWERRGQVVKLLLFYNPPRYE